MKRLIVPLFALPLSPALAEGDYSNRQCAFELFACDMGREDAGTCPGQTRVMAQLFGEGETWYLTFAGGSAAEGDTQRQVEIGSMGPISDDGWTRSFFIVEPGLEGGLSLTAQGDAALSLWVDTEQGWVEDHYRGTCTPKG
jgi:hypothetical protein